MVERARVVVAGGGIVGTALAWMLAERGVSDVVVVDLDLAGIYASSELNAGGVRATWWQPVNIETCRVTLDFFAQNAEEFGFRRRGYLWLYDDSTLWNRALERRKLQNQSGLGVESLPPREISARFPLLDRSLHELVGATWSPRDGLVNPNAVRAGYRERAEARGVRFLNRHYVAGVATSLAAGARTTKRRLDALRVVEVERGDPADASGALREILTTHHVAPERIRASTTLRADAFVNCLGAWSPIFSSKLGVRDHTEPVRRQIALVDVQDRDRPPASTLDDLGMVVDASGLYFHPEGPHILAGYSLPNEPPGFGFEYDGDDFFETHVWPRLAHRSSVFERCGHVRGWAGLYAVTPDRSGIAGAVPGFANLFEAHSFTGRGVMQSLGIARNLAAWMTSGHFDDVDLAPLTSERFSDPSRWVLEELHI